MPQTLVQISTVLTAVLAFSLGVYTLFHNPHSPVNRLWFATSLAVTVWSVGYLAAILAENPSTALISLRAVYTGATLIPILYLHFLTVFLLQRHALLLAIGYAAATIFLWLANFSNFLIQGVRYLSGFGYYEQVGGPIFYLYLGYFFFFTLCALYLLLTAYAHADGVRKRQLLFLLIALVVGIGGAPPTS